MVLKNARTALGSSAALLLLAACSGGGGSAPATQGVLPQSQSRQAFQASTKSVVDSVTGKMGLPAGFRGVIQGARETSPGWLSEDALNTTPKAYVSDDAANAVYIFNAKTPTKPIGTITSGLSSPLGNYVDTAGNLYVTNIGTSALTVYAKGHTSPTKTYTTGLSEPISVVVGKDGTIYVSEFQPGFVVEYDKGKTSPSRVITITQPEGVSLDAKNNLYVSYNGNAGGAVEKFKPKATTGTDLGIVVGFTGDVKVDKKGDILLEDQNTNTVNFYKPGATTSYGSISVGSDAYKLALSSTESLVYVADTVSVPYYDDKPSGALVGTISSGLQSAFGISLSPPPPFDD